MIIWLIEDDGFKREKLRRVIDELTLDSEIIEAKSAKSAINLLVGPLPDVIILDMSLPTFDIGPADSGGRPQAFGGIELLRELDRKGIISPVIVVTQYAVFGSADERMTLDQLKQRLAASHKNTFVDLVSYETTSDQWKVPFANAFNLAIQTKD